MLKYFIVFTILGGVIAKVVKEQKHALIAAIITAVIWGVMSKPIWGLVSLGELLLGYFLVKIFLNKE